MSATTVLAIVAVALVALAAIYLFATAAQRDRSTLEKAAVKPGPQDAGDEGRSREEVERAAVERWSSSEVEPAAQAPPPPEYVDEVALGVTRRQFLNRGITGVFGLGLASFGGAALAFLWPSASGGFGSTITAGNLNDILGEIRDTREPFYVPEGRFYLNPYPTESAAAAEAAGYSGSLISGMEEGIVALYQKCPHLGCRVPWCSSSQWFECPCHGSQYNRVGEKKGGPAPRGMDHFPVSVDAGGTVSVDTGLQVLGAAVGIDTTGQEAEGPHCA